VQHRPAEGPTAPAGALRAAVAQPWRCLWRGSVQITMTRPWRRMIRHLLQIFLTLGLTFTGLPNFMLGPTPHPGGRREG